MGCAIFGGIVPTMTDRVHEALTETWFRSRERGRDS